MKVLVAHPAQQHSYRLATALKRIGILDKYATTVYYKNGSLTSFITKFLNGKFKIKAQKRHCEELSDTDVIQFCEGEGLLKLVSLNTPFFKNRYNNIKYHTADRFAKRVAKYAIKHHVDAVVTYDDSSPLLFETLQENAPEILRILDMSAANILYMRNIYEQDIEFAPVFAERLKRERSICWNPKIMDRAKREIEVTQKFLVPSDFVARSLEFSGVKPEQMYRCPYGVDVSMFSPKELDVTLYKCNRAIKFIYVGGVKELKGISYLLNAFLEIPENEATLTVVGQFNSDDQDIKPYLDRINFIGSVLHSEVAEILRNSDVFIFPSLGDGFSLSVMEAAACGLPVIVSENSGVQELVLDEINGFIVPIQSKDVLIEKIKFFVEHPEKIEPMGRAAREMAMNCSWEVYYKRIEDIFLSIASR